MFGSKPDVTLHVNYMLDKIKKKLWMLRNIKRAGMNSNDMVNVFNTVIRPVCDFASVTYHSMLTAEQAEDIERVQKRAMKLIFGWDTNYSQLLEEGRIESLEERRKRMVINFARKTASNPRFEKWFPKREYNGVELRREQIYEEKFARTERLKKSPVYNMRRELNKLD